MYRYRFPYNNYNMSYNNDRFIAGGALAPFLLGGIAGAAIAPAFYGGYGRPYYNNYYYPYPVYYYRPY